MKSDLRSSRATSSRPCRCHCEKRSDEAIQVSSWLIATLRSSRSRWPTQRPTA